MVILWHSHGGSSPRLRGTLGASMWQNCFGRFIPAPAGNTRPNLSILSPPTVHPRACGEHIAVIANLASACGSSPRLRGTLRHHRIGSLKLRFIPAPAGNTLGTSISSGIITVHPRACGEHSCANATAGFSAGSSPRLRGTPSHAAFIDFERRFIPAPAGNTRVSHPDCVPHAVHPRACGEHGTKSWWTCIISGSSPRLRGTPIKIKETAVDRRFIPAPAGNTTPRTTSPITCAVHPRACGEHFGASCSPGAVRGSSPRLRGTHLQAQALEHCSRFIPAPAGNTGSALGRGSAAAVHPRACGEHGDSYTPIKVNAGSSPRLRGTRSS